MLASLGALALSALLLGLYARGGFAWPLGFVALLPWLWALDRVRGLRGALLQGAAMSMGYVLAVLHWFADAIASYTGWPFAGALLLMASPHRCCSRSSSPMPGCARWSRAPRTRAFGAGRGRRPGSAARR
jgi:hypothetical protein